MEKFGKSLFSVECTWSKKPISPNLPITENKLLFAILNQKCSIPKVSEEEKEDEDWEDLEDEEWENEDWEI